MVRFVRSLVNSTGRRLIFPVLTSLLHTVIEDLKANTREFIGKDDYNVGDITKEVDARVKDEVAKLRNKDEYELGDFLLAMDELSKKYTEELTGKPYEPGDLSTHLDTNIKARVAEFCGKDEYTPGDLTREMASRVEQRVKEFTGKDGYEVRCVERQRIFDVFSIQWISKKCRGF